MVLSDTEDSRRLAIGNLYISLREVGEIKEIISSSAMVGEALCKVIAPTDKGNERETAAKQSRASTFASELPSQTRPMSSLNNRLWSYTLTLEQFNFD